MRTRIATSRLRKRPPKSPSGAVLAGSGVVHGYNPGPVLYHPLSARNRVPEQFRHSEYLHVSDLLKECVRKVAIADTLERVILKDPIYFNIGLVFEQGRAIERFLTEQLKFRLPNELYGKWRCSCQHTEFLGVYSEALDQDKCPKCEQTPVNYNEIEYKDPEYMISGSVDFHLLRDGALLPIESKSINANKWKELTRAEPNHILQVLMYWHLMHRKDLPLHDLALIAYTGKDIYRGFPIKEYPQHASRSMARVEHLIEEATEWAEFKAAGTIPPRRCCTSGNSPKARKCQFAHECFHDFD